MSKNINPEGQCLFGGESRETHEWYLRTGGEICHRCGAKSKDGVWCCVDCGMLLIKKDNVIVKNAAEIRCFGCSKLKETGVS